MLSFVGNSLTGSIPTQIGRLSRLSNGENGFFVECRSDWAQWSGHVLTTGGMCEGRDLLAED